MPSPSLTLLLVVRNECSDLRRAVESLAAQDYAPDQTELIVVDGLSSDGTRDEARRVLDELERSGRRCRLLDNPGLTLAAGWNIGLREATGDYVCRIDAHATVAPDYASRGVAALREPGRENVVGIGGVLSHEKTETFVGRVIADLLGSSFGVGNSPFRVPPKRLTATDTAVFAVYRRDVLLEAGGLDERLKRNQDNDLHGRLARAGWTFLTDPAMHATYRPRSTFAKLMKQGFGNGYWIVFSGGSLRHYIPFVFTMYLLGLLGLVPWLPLPLAVTALVPLLAYIVSSVAFAWKDGRSLATKATLPVFFLPFHLAYGLGTLCGLGRWGKRQKPE